MKSILPRIVALTALGLAPALPARAAESPSVLLQKGIYAEETEGNVDAAIKIYQQIASEAAATRAIIAQAQYRLAVCYQKKGDKEQAIKLLEELVQQSPPDPTVSEKARETLAALGVSPAVSSSIHRISFPVASDGFLGISADARFVAYQPRGTFDIAICELANGKIGTVFKGTKETNAWSVSFLPDGQHIAYNLAGAAIHVAKIDGSETRKLYECGEHKELYLDGWSDDGGRLFATEVSWPKEGITYGTLALDLKTGARKEIAHFAQFKNGQALGGWATSPNARYVAYRIWSYPQRIVLVELKSGHEETVVEGNEERVLDWASDSKFLFSKSRPGAGFDLWAITVKDGQPAGEPELLMPNFGATWSVGITHDGSLYYSPDKKAKTDAAELWVMEGFLAKPATVVNTQTEIPPDELHVGPNHSILDRKYDLAFALPADWAIGAAVRFSKVDQSMIGIGVPGVDGAWLQLFYRINPDPKTTSDDDPRPVLRQMNVDFPKPTTREEMDVWLRTFAERKGEAKRKDTKTYPNYKNRPESFVSRTIGGRAALSWLADFTKDGKKRTEYTTEIYSNNLMVQPLLQAPSEKIDAIRPVVDELIDTIRSP
jgi:tetratricopeptide (TPR) repeat protein